MSVKAMSLVWDMKCPDTIQGIEFKAGHKYVLIAYADHADQQGRNIYPAVQTIARKTGYEERSVQRLTHELEEMGVLVGDGMGPRGTNRFYIPFSGGGDKISPLTKFQGDISPKSLGDIPSGDIPSGDKISPELKELNLDKLIINNNSIDVWGEIKTNLKSSLRKAQFDTWVADTEGLGYCEDVLVVGAKNSYTSEWLNKNIKQKAQQESGVFIHFVVLTDELVKAGEA